ncbi:MAG: hypothetical protein LAO09_10205 [Acidobacteriia bacterium]|nr:hypothetical protein [Terriglobia bacterium]
MKWFTATLLLACLVPSSYGVQKQYATGKIVAVEQKANTKVLYYLVNTPVTQDEPYYEVSVQLKDTIYLGQYTPWHAKETLPEEWEPGFTVPVRIDGRHLILKRPSGVDMEFVILKRTAVKAEPKVPAPTPATK